MNEARIEALAKVIAGFAFPGHGTWTRVPKRLQDVALFAARDALETCEDAA